MNSIRYIGILLSGLFLFLACWCFDASAKDQKRLNSHRSRQGSGQGWLQSLSDPNRWTEGSGLTQWRTIKCGGKDRTYLLYTPHGSKPSSPLVIACHGGGGNARRMDKLTGGISKVADREKFIIVYPEGLDKHWNDGRTVNLTETSDVEFISSMIDELVSEGIVDPARVYSTGISNGGFFSLYLAKKIPHKLAAVASVAATLPELYTKFESTEPMPVLYILGTDDPLVPYNGGEVGGKVLRKKRGRVLSAGGAVDYWLTNNGIGDVRPRQESLDTDNSDGISILIKDYRSGDKKRDVLVYEITGGGHTWPRGWKYLPEWLIGKTASDINANEIIWKFFSEHSKGNS